MWVGGCTEHDGGLCNSHKKLVLLQSTTVIPRGNTPMDSRDGVDL